MDRLGIVTRAEAKAICNIRPQNLELDDAVDHLIMVASQQIEDAVGRLFTKQVFTEYMATKQTIDTVMDLYGGSETGTKSRVRASTIYLRSLNIDTSDFEIRYDTNRVFGDDSIIDPVDYIIDEEKGSVRLLFGTAYSERALKVTYTGGWDKVKDDLRSGEAPAPEVFCLSADIPYNIKEACLLQIGYLHARRRKDNIGLTGDRSTGKGDSFVQTMSWGSKQGLTREAVGLIAHLKRPIMGRY